MFLSSPLRSPPTSLLRVLLSHHRKPNVVRHSTSSKSSSNESVSISPRFSRATRKRKKGRKRVVLFRFRFTTDKTGGQIVDRSVENKLLLICVFLIWKIWLRNTQIKKRFLWRENVCFVVSFIMCFFFINSYSVHHFPFLFIFLFDCEAKIQPETPFVKSIIFISW